MVALPALKLRVVYVSQLLLAARGRSVSQEFNEVQSGFKRLLQGRRHVVGYRPLLWLPERRKFIC